MSFGTETGTKRFKFDMIKNRTVLTIINGQYVFTKEISENAEFSCRYNRTGKHVVCKNCLKECWVNRVVRRKE